MVPESAPRIGSPLSVEPRPGVILCVVDPRQKGRSTRAMVGEDGGETMRPDASRNKVILALKRAIEATFDEGKWLELGYLIGREDLISRHPRLLRSLQWGDPDYSGHVMSVIPSLLGKNGPTGPRDEYLEAIEKFMGLEAWLREHDQKLFAELYRGDLLPLTEVEDAAGAFSIADLNRHAVRIRNGIRSDPAQAIGSAKELLETVLNCVLEEHGATSPDDIPALLKRACKKLGLDVASVDAAAPGAEVVRRILGNLGQAVTGVAQVRNGYGTGHGRVNGRELEIAQARLVVNGAVAIATFLLEVWQAQRSG